MKKLILKYLRYKGYSLIRSKRKSELIAKEAKLSQALREHFFLAKEHIKEIPLSFTEAKSFDTLNDLLGTTPFEGLAITNAFFQTIDLEGDICEFGVAQGRTSKLLATLIAENKSKKKLCLFDSFQGLSKPMDQDVLIDDIFNLGSMAAYEGEMTYSKEFVVSEVASTDIDERQVEIYEGYIEKTILSEKRPKMVSLAYIDFDLYAPIKTALIFLNQFSPSGAIFIIDDYDYFSSGAKKAVEEFLETNHGYSQFVPPKELGHFCILTKK